LPDSGRRAAHARALTNEKGKTMTRHNPVEVGVFEHYRAAEDAVERLIAAGFDREAISVVCPTCSLDQLRTVEHVRPAGASAPAAAATGGVIGTLLGGLTAAGVAATGMALVTAGPLLAAAAVGGVTAAFIGAMSTRGFESEVSNFYDQALSKGQILVAVDTERPEGPGRAMAESVLLRSGALPLALPRG